MATRIIAQPRTDFGKGFARRARRDGFVPGVLYGHGAETAHLLLPGHEIFLVVKGSANALVKVEIEGTEHLALVKDVQRHAVRRDILHVDLFAVSQGEKVEVEVPVVVVGEPQSGMAHSLETFSVLVAAPATDLPEQIEVSIDGLGDGDVLYVRDIVAPAGLEILTDGDQDVISVHAPRGGAASE